MKINNNTIAIIGIVIVAVISILAAIKVPESEIAVGLVALGSTAIGGIIGYLAKSQIPEKDDILENLEKENDIVIDENLEDKSKEHQ